MNEEILLLFIENNETGDYDNIITEAIIFEMYDEN